MAKRENFNDLINSIQDAFLQVNRLSEMQHLDMVKNYFDENNNPICIDVHYPYFDGSGSIAYRKVAVPKLCLVPISSLKLNEVSVDFKVKLYGKVQLTEHNDAENGEKKEESNHNKIYKPKKSSYLGYIPSGFGIRNDSDNSYASIKLKFVSEEAPEGLMRINDELTKIMI